MWNILTGKKCRESYKPFHCDQLGTTRVPTRVKFVAYGDTSVDPRSPDYNNTTEILEDSDIEDIKESIGAGGFPQYQIQNRLILKQGKASVMQRNNNKSQCS